MNVANAITFATEALRTAGTPEPARDAKVLLAHSLGKQKTFLIAYPEFELTDEQQTRFSTVIERRAGREPLQHILGRQEFYGRDFRVSPDVLIPRPETEAIVELAVRFLADRPEPRFLDIGTGSGCIAVSVAAELPAARGWPRISRLRLSPSPARMPKPMALQIVSALPRPTSSARPAVRNLTSSRPIRPTFRSKSFVCSSPRFASSSRGLP